MGAVAHLLDDLQWRGLISTSTDLAAIRTLLDSGPTTLYCGFDPTAPSLHLGNLAQILTMRRFQLTGHRPLALVGGATGLIGDPKSTGERQLNEVELVNGWVDRIGQQLARFYDFDGTNAALLVNNYAWTAQLSAIQLLRDLGKHFSVNRMLDREAVAARLAANGISYTEFSYQVLQANDYLELHRRYGCSLQTGGSDQWGNIVAGVDLVRRVTGQTVHAITTPLITKADGTKFGKTESGTVWLDPELTTPYAFYQFWINVDDRDVGTMLRTFSFADREQITALDDQTATAPHARAAQRYLARELTTLVHGESEADAVEFAAMALFGRESLHELDPSTLAAALSETQVADIAWSDGELPTVVDLAMATGLAASRGAARRAIAEGGLYLNNERVTTDDQRPTPANILPGGWIVLRRGKKSIAAARVGERPAPELSLVNR